jgi:hypothetical protein
MLVNRTGRSFTRNFARSFWAFNAGEGGGGGGGDNPFAKTKDEAIAALEKEGFKVLAQKPYEDALEEKRKEGYQAGESDAKKSWSRESEELKQLRNEKASWEKHGKEGYVPKHEVEQMLEAERKKTQEALDKVNKQNDVLKENAILRAAAEGKAIKPEAVVELIKSKVTMDENGQFFIDDGKGGRMMKNGEYVGVQSFVADYLKENPWLVSSSGNAGAGSNTGGGQNTGGTVSNEQLASMPMEDYIAMGGLRGAGKQQQS